MAKGHGRPDANQLRFLLLAGMLVVAGVTTAIANPSTVELQSGYEQYSLNAYASYLVDAKGGMDVDTVAAADQWQLNAAGGVLNFGFTSATVWVRLRLLPPALQNESWHLVIPYPLLEHADLYLLREGRYHSVAAESITAEVRSHYQHFPLPRSDSQPLDLLLRVESFTSLQIPLELWTQGFLINRQSVESMIWGLYFGVLLALMAYNAFLFASMRDVAYLHYVLYLGSMVVLMLGISGFGQLYVWQSTTAIRYLLPVSTGMASLWSILFALAFLRGCGIHPTLLRILRGGAVLSLLLALYALAGTKGGALASGALAIVTVGIVILAGLNALATGAVIARYFILAWTAFALGTLIYVLNIFNLVPVSRITSHAVQAGSALEAVLLSFALAHRIKEERRQKLHALEQKAVAEQQVKMAQALALERALHDNLTQRPNDALLVRRMQELIRSHGPVDAFALVLFYCPQLKEISSSLGRRLAEEVFCAVVEDMNRLMTQDAQNIAIETASGSCVAVTEFGSLVALCAIGDDLGSMQEYAQRYLALYDRHIDIDGVLLDLDIVCGIACYPKQGDRADLLLQHAAAARDFGLRTAESVTIYSSEIESFGRRRLMLIGALSQAIRDGELELYLQPQVEAGSLILVGAEVLLRWNSPRFGAVSPKEFIEVAEQAGLMGMLTRYVIDGAFALLAGFQRNGVDITLSINLSIQNLIEPGIVHYVTAAASSASINLSDVVLEVTETSMSENMDQVIDSLQQLASAGCCIALDDYGTGYSSLAYLSRLPIHELKVDRSFIAQMQRSDSDFRIVENTVKLARALQIQTVAEGVEDAATLALITRLGCDRVQGFYIGKPMPPAQFREWMLRRGIQRLENSASQ